MSIVNTAGYILTTLEIHRVHKKRKVKKKLNRGEKNLGKTQQTSSSQESSKVAQWI